MKKLLIFILINTALISCRTVKLDKTSEKTEAKTESSSSSDIARQITSSSFIPGIVAATLYFKLPLVIAS